MIFRDRPDVDEFLQCVFVRHIARGRVSVRRCDYYESEGEHQVVLPMPGNHVERRMILACYVKLSANPAAPDVSGASGSRIHRVPLTCKRSPKVIGQYQNSQPGSRSLWHSLSHGFREAPIPVARNEIHKSPVCLPKASV